MFEKRPVMIPYPEFRCLSARWKHFFFFSGDRGWVGGVMHSEIRVALPNFAGL